MLFSEDQEGTTKMRNASHMKKFIHRDPSLETSEGKEETNL